MCVKVLGRQPNSVRPITDLQSERLEIRKDRILRVIHLDSASSRISVGSDRGSRDESQSTVSGRSANYGSTIAVFFIHGVGGSADLWYEQLTYFSRAGYEVIAPDLLGHGESLAPRDESSYAFSELCDDMITLFDRYHKKRNVLVGHSYGASFCTMIAALRARFVSKMVLISGGGPTALMPDNYHLFCLPTPILRCIQPFVLCTFNRRAYHRNTSRTLVKKYKSFSAPTYVLKATMEGQIWEDGDEDFHTELMVPVLLIHGEQDHFVTLEEEQQMQSVIYNCALEVVKDAGHMVMIECPQKVNRLVQDFLQRDSNTRSKESVHMQVALGNEQNSVSAASLSGSREDFQHQRPATSQHLTSAWNAHAQASGTSHSAPDNLGPTRHHCKHDATRAKQIGVKTSEDTNVLYGDGVLRDGRGLNGISKIHSSPDSSRRRRSLRAWFSPKHVRRKGVARGSSSAPSSPVACRSSESAPPDVEC